MIRFNVFIQVSEENRSAVINIAKQLVEKSVKEEGCIAYDFFESTTRKDILMFCETWQDEKSIAAHSNTEHFVKLLPELQKLCTLKMEKFLF